MSFRYDVWSNHVYLPKIFLRGKFVICKWRKLHTKLLDTRTMQFTCNMMLLMMLLEGKVMEKKTVFYELITSKLHWEYKNDKLHTLLLYEPANNPEEWLPKKKKKYVWLEFVSNYWMFDVTHQSAHVHTYTDLPDRCMLVIESRNCINATV